ncbi:hypothetical protein C3B58_14730 [Lactonifactor longoviformis]|uniref:Stage 0 sporulation protein A homolog n=1 Tax=Lactonifactor longoviformis DSM 17459 TaxID=1122155 RepID=A0A1M4WBW0_9CLOT|nr:response regulator [Lactonifactor longoviformis]POP31824.1 hypothetical protein C3B58_14730 [Lactonifactor longoviformis]SHE78640.1 Two-component response regulator, YesN/AraC family, consists of REC and AraC-type DNA-binding domains [Lactonifactor longoviformis DSM 17459]
MKIRVMIVEDEPIIRMGIASVLPWDEIDCEVVALAENGVDGLEKAKSFQPQLVISDIRMPKMDGLSMIETLVSANPDIQVILLTGYKEFEYAQRAISFGVSNYILKPVDQDELLEVVKELAEKIKKSIALKKEKELLKAKVKESLPILKDKFISSLLFSSPDTLYRVCEKMEYFNLRIDRFAILNIEIDSFHELEKGFTEDDVQILLFLIVEQIEELLPDYGFTAITFHHKKSVYAIIGGDKEMMTKELLPEYARELGERIESCGRFSVSIGISRAYEGAANIRKARIEADKCAVQSYYLGAGSVICYSDLQNISDSGEGVAEVETEAFFEALRQGGDIAAEARHLCDQLKNVKNIIIVKSTVAEWISKSYRYLMEDYGESTELSESLETAMEKTYYAKSLQNFMDIMNETSGWIEGFISQKQLSRTEYIMDRAVQYMRENCRREISLEEVADQVYVSKWYFSKLFRKEKGIKFSDYMSALRIDQAQKIIRENPSLKNYEVADMVGFGNVRYFSQLFKKITGKTPSEFRG